MSKDLSSQTKRKLLSKLAQSLATFLGFLLFVLAGVVLVLNIKQQTLPYSAQAHIFSEISKLTGNDFNADKIFVGLENGMHPVIVAEKIEIHNGDIGVFKVDHLRLKLNLECAFRFQICAEHIAGHGLKLSVFRNSDGQIYIENMLRKNSDTQIDTKTDFFHFLDTVKNGLGKGKFQTFNTLNFNDISLDFFDLKNKESWKIANGTLNIAQNSDTVSAQLDLPILHENQLSGALKFSLEHPISSNETHFTAALTNFPLKDASTQIDSLLWLKAFETYADLSVSGILTDRGKISDLKGDIKLAPGRIVTEKFGITHFDNISAKFGYNFQTHQLDVSDLHLATSHASLKARATASLAIPKTAQKNISTQLIIEELSLPKSNKSRTEIRGSFGKFHLLLKQNPLRVELVKGAFQLDDTALNLSGVLSKKKSGLDIALDITSPQLSVEKVKAFWPIGVKENALGWINKNTSGGMLHNVDINFRMTPDGKTTKSTVNLDIIDMEMIYVPGLPQLKEIGGHLEIKDDTLFLDIYKGRIKTGQSHFVSAAGTRLRLDQLKINKNPVAIDLKMTGKVPAFLRLLDTKPLSLITQKGLSTDVASGKGAMHAAINFKLAKKIKMADIAYSFGGKVQNISSEKLVKGHLIEAEFLTISGDNKAVKIYGNGVLDNIPFTAEWNQTLSADTADRSEVTGEFELSNRTLRAFNIPLPANILSGTGRANFAAQLSSSKPPNIILRSNLDGIRLSFSQLDWALKKSAQGKLVAELTLGSVSKLKNLTLKTKNLTLRSSANFHKNAKLKNLNLEQLTINNRIDISAKITRNENDNLILAITGGKINLTALPKSQEFRESIFSTITANFDQLKLADGIILSAFRGVFETTLGLQGTFTARLEKSKISGEITPTSHGFAAQITSDNSGPIFAYLGILETMEGGDMTLNVISNASASALEGTLSVKNFRIIDAPILLQLLSDLSIVGLLEKLGGTGIAFSRMDANFSLDKKKISLSKASLEGASLGLAGHGSADLSAKTLDFDLIVSPLYALNIPLKGRGESLFGFAASINGPFSQPVISVNPLIGILPWPLRDLFLKKYKK